MTTRLNWNWNQLVSFSSSN